VRRRLLALTVVPLLLFGAAACGEDTGGAGDSTETASNVDMGETIEGLEVTGEVGEEPEVTVDAPLEIDDTQSQVITAGEGAPVVANEQALLHLYVANGTTGEKAAATYDQGTPVNLTLSEDQFFPAVLDAITDKPVGSRVAVAAVPEDAYGAQGMEQLQLGPDDNVLFVVDIMSAEPTDVLEGPEGEEQDVPADVPTVEETDGDVTNIDFANAPENPADKLQVITLIEGDGPPARDDSLVTFDYFGQVYGTDKVFDESYSKEPVTFPLGVGGLIKGWDEGLVGINRGSRVLVIAPPEYGYGEGGNPQAGIGGTDTLAFVVDILGVG
jgi:peptidylprolyl isomerase